MLDEKGRLFGLMCDLLRISCDNRPKLDEVGRSIISIEIKLILLGRQGKGFVYESLKDGTRGVENRSASSFFGRHRDEVTQYHV